MRRLLESADIEEAGAGKYRVVDPLYAEWIARVDAGLDTDPDADVSPLL